MHHTLIALALLFMCAEARAQNQQGNKFGVPPPGASAVTSIIMPQDAVSKLPTCNLSAAGLLRIVTDANGPTFGSTLAGGGATVTLALCNGTNWTAH